MVEQKNNLAALSIGIVSIGLCMPQSLAISHAGVDFSCNLAEKEQMLLLFTQDFAFTAKSVRK